MDNAQIPGPATRIAIYQAGFCTRQEVEDGLITAGELEALGWLKEPDTDNWASPMRTARYRHVEAGIGTDGRFHYLPQLEAPDAR